MDAGKTTFTERMLYYSNTIRSMGDVEHGDTTTDFMLQERERGITIQSACITFDWNGATVNLVDTPGHVDFTVEVERSMRVLDGAVLLVDAVSGVQAQTETVWNQANQYNVPRIVLINKMDLTGACMESAVASVENSFAHPCLVVQLPLGESQGFHGVIDLFTLDTLTWDYDSKEHTTLSNLNNGDNYEREPLLEDSVYYNDAVFARNALIEACAELDDELSEAFLMEEPISASELQAAVRRVVLNRKGVAVLCCSSFKKRGVQPAMDALVPSPQTNNARTHTHTSRI